MGDNEDAATREGTSTQLRHQRCTFAVVQRHVQDTAAPSAAVGRGTELVRAANEQKTTINSTFMRLQEKQCVKDQGNGCKNKYVCTMH